MASIVIKDNFDKKKLFKDGSIHIYMYIYFRKLL